MLVLKPSYSYFIYCTFFVSSRFMILFDESSSTSYLFSCSMRWLALRLDFLAGMALKHRCNKQSQLVIRNSTCNLFIASKAASMMITAAMVVVLRGTLSAAFAGLALAYAGQLSGIMQYTVRLALETETRFTSVQRMQTYIQVSRLKFSVTSTVIGYCYYNYQSVESEGGATILDRRPPDNWPQKGSIRFTDVKLKYRPHLPLVLKGVSLHIEPREKIGHYIHKTQQ